MVNRFASLESQVPGIGESATGVSSPTASAFSTFTYQKTADTLVESQIKDFQHGLRFREHRVQLQMGVVNTSFAEGALPSAFRPCIV